MINPTYPSPTDPNNQTDDPANYANDNQIQQDTQQWVDDKNAMEADNSAIQQAIQEMEQALASGKPDAVFAAMMSFFMNIFPDILQFQQDNMNLLADSQNIASDLRGFVNSIQNDFNAGATVTSAQATDLYNNTQDLKSWATFLSTGNSSWSATDSPLDPTDGHQIVQQADGVSGAFTTWGSPGSIQSDMQSWFATPNGTAPVNPPQQIKTIQGALQQANSSVSTMATTTQTTEQFYTNQYNQLTGIDNSMQQNTASGITAFVNNQKNT